LSHLFRNVHSRKLSEFDATASELFNHRCRSLVAKFRAGYQRILNAVQASKDLNLPRPGAFTSPKLFFRRGYLQPFDQFRGVDRLGDLAVEARSERPLAIVRTAVRSHRDD
jgi:hypothetical protein